MICIACNSAAIQGNTANRPPDHLLFDSVYDSIDKNEKLELTEFISGRVMNARLALRSSVSDFVAIEISMAPD